MLEYLRSSGRLKITILLASMSLFCFTLSIFRVLYTFDKAYLFLNWNLFLAFIPWCASTFISVNKKYSSNKSIMLSLLAVWLLFFPNAPYMLTDLFHLKDRMNFPEWFDLIIILSFAWTGLAYGFISLIDIADYLAKYMKRSTLSILTAGLLFMTSFGIYLGRFQRWNSWDILNPAQWNIRLGEIADRFINPLSHPRTWGMTILMGILLNMMYWTVRVVMEKREIYIKK